MMLRAGRETPGDLPQVPAGAPDTVRLRLVEGMAMGHAHLGCSDELRAALLTAHPDVPGTEAVWYGLGRADLYCAAFPRLPGDADSEAFARGKADGVSHDYGAPVEELRVY